MEAANERLADNAALDRVAKAMELWPGAGDRLGQVQTEHLAILLGMVVRRLDTLNTQVDFLEKVLTTRQA